MTEPDPTPQPQLRVLLTALNEGDLDVAAALAEVVLDLPTVESMITQVEHITFLKHNVPSFHNAFLSEFLYADDLTVHQDLGALEGTPLNPDFDQPVILTPEQMPRVRAALQGVDELRSEVTRRVVDTNGVSWRGDIKHTDMEWYTGDLPLATLRLLRNELIARQDPDYDPATGPLALAAARHRAAAAEAAHAQASDGLTYPNEVRLTIAESGMQVAFPDAHVEPDGVSYVRVLKDGREIAYWDSAEWADAPQEVMGALLAALTTPSTSEGTA